MDFNLAYGKPASFQYAWLTWLWDHKNIEILHYLFSAWLSARLL